MDENVCVINDKVEFSLVKKEVRLLGLGLGFEKYCCQIKVVRKWKYNND